MKMELKKTRFIYRFSSWYGVRDVNSKIIPLIPTIELGIIVKPRDKEYKSFYSLRFNVFGFYLLVGVIFR